jgi:hypothetical protein
MKFLMQYGGRKAAYILALLGLCLTLIAGQNNFWDYEKPMNATNCPHLDIWNLAKLEWNNPIDLEVITLGPLPPDVAQITGRPGPKYYPVRPYIEETFANPAGLASMVALGTGQTMPIAVLVGKNTKVIQLSEEPVNLSARSDGGVWTNYPLSHYDSTGTLKRVVEVPGYSILGVEKDAVWMMSFDEAWFVSSSGDVRGPYPWKGFNSSVGSGVALCTLEGGSVRRVQCLEPDGQKRFVAPFLSQNPKGGLLAFSDNWLLTGDRVGGALSYYNSAGVAANLNIENAGITSTGEAFVSFLIDNKWADVCLSNRTSSRRFGIQYNTSSFPIPLRLSVSAVEGDRTLVYGFDRAVWYKGDRIEKSFAVDDNVYRKDIFPHQWRTYTHFLTANSSDGTIILSTSGPTGMALIGMRWHPESK